ncbi:hypothetical protein GGR56DRAFT_489133 [Xylariaceae sp. FL0804]|nr:hypothetical protein GGR56DRAFT_489133 [Xylariaceae sp. FL0804]
MNPATPRMRFGGYPETPAPGPRRQPAASPTRDARPRPSLPPAPENIAGSATASEPLIPLTIIDAPTQRFYAFGIWVALMAWRLYDWLQVYDDGNSYWTFTKWVIIDFVYLFSLPSLRIPWLEMSSELIIIIFSLQAFFTWCMMFDIPLPGQASLLGLLKLFYDKETAISEHSVKVSNILHNSSLIMGKQIINILPEGSALLNPTKTPYCVGKGKNTVTVPLYFNATVPVEVELIRYDLDTNAREIVKLGRKEIKEIGKQAAKCEEGGAPGTYQYDVTLKKSGAYQLHKVLDEYKLEVQRLTEPTYVVPCPKARVRTAESTPRCLGDLSDLSLEVEGTPPLKIVYSRTINGKDHSFHFQSLQPDGFSSPLLTSHPSSMILPGGEDFTWARSQKVRVGLNESMNNAGDWQYSVDEVHDAFGNVVKYQPQDELDAKPKPKGLSQQFKVRERPRAAIVGCDTGNPLKVAKGKSSSLPIRFGRPGKTPNNEAHTLTWLFSPIDTLTKSGDHGDVVETASVVLKNANEQPKITAPGLYTLKSVSSDSCEGEIDEPSSCLLLNPLQPTLEIQSEEIPDKCAGNSIGLRVNLDLAGTPPFRLHYAVSDGDGRSRNERVDIDGLRHQFELRPRRAGRHSYRFRKLEDAIYSVPLPLSDEYYLEQNVKPPASASFQGLGETIYACLDQPVKLDVELLGDGPFTLEWELVHDGKRKAQKATDLVGNTFTIETAPLSSGGDYTLALKSVQDKSGCRIFLKEEAKISVRRQKPRVSFGLLENKRATTVVEAAQVNLPLRLSGDGPWRVSYHNKNSTLGTQTRVARSSNDFIEAKERGVYEILDVMDSQCPGTVDPKANSFKVEWFPRPELSLVPSDTIWPGDTARKFVKKDICEGDVDGFEVALRGSPPYHVEYEVRYKPVKGSGSVARRDFDAVLGKSSVQMDTSRAGTYSYTFSALADNLYNNDNRKSTPLTLEQTVNTKPSASFVKPGQTFKSCMADNVDEEIPIRLEGKAPFYLELEIKHHLATIPEIFRIPNIQSNSHNIKIPRQYLKLGAQQIRIRRVRDDRGCQAEVGAGGPAVHFQLYEAPTIYALEPRTDYCVGERLSYTLSGVPPFEIHYEFGGRQMKAKSQTTNFRRIAESPGDFAITSISDKASECRAAVNLTRHIHELPSVKISKGRVVQTDIHEGSEVEILFEFWGTPPFDFTYTRSTNAHSKGKGGKGGTQKSEVLETRHETSEHHSKIVTASLEGTYEVVAIKDRYCAVSASSVEATGQGQKLLQYH